MKLQRFTAALLVLNAPFLKAADSVDFVKDIKPIIELNCVKCHGPQISKGKLRLDTKEGALKGGGNGTALVPGKPDQSPLYKATTLSPDHDDVMPPAKEGQLAKSQTELLRAWIEQGAYWPDGLTLTAVKKVDFAKDIQPIFEFNCVACHREGHSKGGLRMDSKVDAFKGGDGGPGIIAGKRRESSIYISTTASPDDERLMPPKNKGGPLPKEQIEIIAKWIDQGAFWPEGLKLVPKKAEEVPGANEPQVVADIHKLILSRLDVTNETAMLRYTNIIPGTTITYAMVPIPGGEFLMGSPETERGRKPDESPQHKVKIAPFWMGQFEVTWNEYELFMYPGGDKQLASAGNQTYSSDVADAVTRPTKPYVEMSFGMGKEGYPAISMTQHAANKYCEWLSAKTGHFYRLPTEAEWEYACRAGTTTAYSFGDDPSKLGEYAWYGKNSDYKYQKVGRMKPNQWGLYDMHGNVAEWCLDQYDPNYYKQIGVALAVDPWNRATKPYPHVARGGSWNDDDPARLRSAARLGSDPSWKAQDPQLPKSVWYHTDAQFLGFRIVRPLKVPSPEELPKYWTSGVEKD
ncbi:MAG: hypothetical protein DME26_22280 [Verrucomicrobia bacterium]|nr:MAG: hypothetical protein DME26_22280 [Verrucomicrobiota bacterium]